MISGMVVRDGSPTEGAYVRLIGPSDEYVSERRTGADGCFRFPGLTDGSGWRLVVLAPGGNRVEQDLPPGADETIIVTIPTTSGAQ